MIIVFFLTFSGHEINSAYEAKPCVLFSNPYRSGGTWGELPEDRVWGAVIGVYPDSKGNMLVFERCYKNTCLGSDRHPILKFDTEGNLLDSFGGGMYLWPHGFYVDQKDNIWVIDAMDRWLSDAEPYQNQDIKKMHTMVKFSPDGEVLFTLGEPGLAGDDQNHMDHPSDVVVVDNGDTFMADGHQSRGYSWIVKYAPDKFILFGQGLTKQKNG